MGEKNVAEKLSAAFPGLPIRTGELLKDRTSFRIGGPAGALVMPRTEEEAARVYGFLCRAQEKILILGNGTNLLVSDKGFDGAVLCMDEFLTDLQLTGETEIYASAGALLSRVAVLARDNGLTGFEFAHGIPGSVGGAVCMNAGAYGGEIAQVAQFVRAADKEGNIVEIPVEKCEFSYRHSLFMQDYLVLGLSIRLVKGEKEAICEKMNELSARRRASQPLNFPSAGSFFKRPAGHFAGALIEGAGLKGVGIGGARISEKHAGFLISDGTATFGDVIATMEMTQKKVQEQTGILLEPEVRIIR